MEGGNEFIRKAKGSRVHVKLNSGEIFEGTFTCLDGCLNIVLADAKCSGDTYTEILIRGNNVLYIAAAEKKTVKKTPAAENDLQTMKVAL